jgi:hypothetical protein
MMQDHYGPQCYDDTKTIATMSQIMGGSKN